MQETTALTTTPVNLIEQAIEKGLGVEELGKLLDLQERWEARQAEKEFDEALTAFQEECPDLRKTKNVNFTTKSGGTTNYNYAPLADIDRQIKGLMKKHGFTKSWDVIREGSKITGVTCILKHKAGHKTSATVPVTPDNSGGKNEIQAAGSAMQYGQRYSLIAVLGLTTADTDIDGRLPELDVDKLHNQYMELFDKVVEKQPEMRTAMDPDNWNADRTADLYVKAIGKARQLLAKLTPKKP